MKKPVYDITAPVQRMTKTAAFLVATALSIPVFIMLSVIEWLWL
ncbi:MAG: hypothetical protein P8Q26_12685 [Ascidiaceihabitans sp.]|nr:hypothetical protein [Ascidiaceihabitans sp.]